MPAYAKMRTNPVGGPTFQHRADSETLRRLAPGEETEFRSPPVHRDGFTHRST